MSDMVLPADFFALLHILVAGWVSAHVLLHKDNVRSAIGWIGLAWLSPFLGSGLYFLFGINRVQRRAANLNRDLVPAATAAEQAAMKSAQPLGVTAQLAGLVTTGDHATGRKLMGGNAIDILRSGDKAYPAMLAAIRGARHSIALASYIFRRDAAGQAFCQALGEAMARGVEIRVLIDGIGGGYIGSGGARLLAQHKIPFARFLHDWRPWRMPLLNMRNHKKILIVDGAIGFTGGINIGAENLLATQPTHPVTDIHFQIDGPAVHHLMMAFTEDWAFTTGELLNDSIWWPVIGPAGPAYARGITEGPDEDMDKLETVMLAAIGEACSRVRIVTPYFLPNERLVSALILAAMRGVIVEAVIPARSNKLIVDWAVRAHLGRLIEAGVRVFRTAPPFNHAKLMTIDESWCLIGSANWDERSLRLNFEFNVEIYDEAVGGRMNRLIDEMISAAAPQTIEALQGRSMPIKLWDAAARLFLPYL